MRIPRLSSRLIYYNIKARNEVISQDEVGSKKVGERSTEREALRDGYCDGAKLLSLLRWQRTKALMGWLTMDRRD